jgi:hypothetical protein
MTRSVTLLPRPVLAFVILFLGGTLAFCTESQSPSLFAASAVREALKEHGIAPEMRSFPRTSSELRSVVSRNLDPRLLNETQSIFGRDFQYMFPNANLTVQLGVIELKYPDVAVTKRMAALSVLRQNYFRSSKILIRFVSIPLDNLLIIIYSENSGDDRIVGAIDNLPTRFEKASTNRSVTWGEPDPPKTS